MFELLKVTLQSVFFCRLPMLKNELVLFEMLSHIFLNNLFCRRVTDPVVNLSEMSTAD